MPAPSSDEAVPDGLRIILDPDVRSFDHGRTLLNRSSGRLLRVSAQAQVQIDALAAGSGASAAGRRLGRRLVSAGLAHPRPASVQDLSEVTVVIPVRDR